MQKRLPRPYGFTLIELLVIISILALLAATVILNWPGTMIQLNAQTQQLAQEIRYTQSLAVSRAQPYSLRFISNRTYVIMDSQGTLILHPLTNQSSTSLPTTMSASFSNLPYSLVTFDSHGTPYTDSALTAPLTTTATITLTASPRSRTITITPTTGKVTVS